VRKANAHRHFRLGCHAPGPEGDAVNAAAPGATVVVCQGIYHEQVVVTKPLTLAGQLATIDESGVNPWLKVTIPHIGTVKIFAAVVIVSSDVRFSGLRVQHAQGEGILAAGLGRDISGITISHSAVALNDLGFGFPNVIGNVIGRNNIGGDPLDFPASPKDDKTTGILVFSGGTHITLRIAFNNIISDAIGIWLSKAVSASGLKTNRFTNVGTHILAGQ
jgi:nitrous oxidase accessory protein NosD